MRVVTTRDELSCARAELGTIGFVPTMGYLHDGHLSLVRAARSANDAVVVSIFVNPTQFGPGEDLASYPRDLDRDLTMLAAEGVDLVWTPRVEDVYPPGSSTRVRVGGVTEVLEGARRPGHLDGVATVCTILFGAVRPTRPTSARRTSSRPSSSGVSSRTWRSGWRSASSPSAGSPTAWR